MKPEVWKMITGAQDNQHGVPVVKTPQFPGVNPGMSIEQVRSVIRKQVRAKGFLFGLSNGSNNEDIQLSGTARVFLGFSLDQVDVAAANAATQFTITINNEIVIDSVHPVFFSSAFMDDEYYFFPRPLSGQDTITIDIESPADENMQMIVYYI